MATIAEGAAISFPNDPEFLWQFAWAKSKSGEVEPWVTALLSQAPRFPNDSEFAYRLACLLAVVDRLDEARLWLKHAIERSVVPRDLKLRALAQPELARLWTGVQESGPNAPTRDSAQRWVK